TSSPGSMLWPIARRTAHDRPRASCTSWSRVWWGAFPSPRTCWPGPSARSTRRRAGFAGAISTPSPATPPARCAPSAPCARRAMGAEPLAPGEARRAAEELARGAGAVLLEHASRSFEIDYKSVQDLVTSADRASEAYLVAEIERRYPGHAIVAEEGSGRDRTARYRWLVDPLDGTTNFAHGYPFYAVSVAVEEADAGRESARGPRGAIVAGAVYDPQRDECFSAARGQGASLNGRAIHVSAVSRLERGLLATGFPYDFRERPRESLDAFEAFLHEAQAVRRDGSAALN